MTLSQNVIDFVNLPFPPARRQTGAHGGHAGWAAGFEGGIALSEIAHKATSLGGDGVEGTDEGVETLANVGGVEGFVIDGEG